MHTSLAVISRYTVLPECSRAARRLLDEVGIEVKRIDHSMPGVPITVELLANRGDHYCVTGLAREVHGRTGKGLCLPRTHELTIGEAAIPVRRVSERCTNYTATLLVRDGEEGALPEDVLGLLEAAGLESKGAVVDATNVVNLELGQPTHAFDADKIMGSVVIRESRAGETALPLFAETEIEVPEGTLVIADDEKILAIAGVIGCESSKATETTTRVLLESASFDPVAVRKAGTALQIHTDSRARFERGSDVTLPLVAAGRVAELLSSCGWRVEGTSTVLGSLEAEQRVVTLNPALANAFLGLELTPEDMTARLERYGFGVAVCDATHLEVTVPAWRLWDVAYAADLYEELAKSVGYDVIPTTLPNAGQGTTPSADEQARECVENVLIGHGFFEVITDGFHGRPLSERLGLPDGHALLQHVETANALDRAYSLLKNCALPQALEGLVSNLHLQQDEVKAFEFTRTFHPDATADNGICTERHVCWALAHGLARGPRWTGGGDHADLMFMKGVVEELALALRVPLTIDVLEPDHAMAALLHPGRSAAIHLRGEQVGVFGEVHPRLRASFKLKKSRPVYLEIEASVWHATPEPFRFEAPPRVPPVRRSLAFTLPFRVPVNRVVQTLTSSGPDWLRGVRVADLFAHTSEDGQPLRTITFELSWDNSEGNRTAAELNGATEALIEAVASAHGPDGVVLR